MYNKIAVVTDENNQITSLERGNKVLLYQETADGWQLVKEASPQLVTELVIAEIRNVIRVLIEQLEDCRIIVSKKLTGVPYHIFNKIGFHIYETDGPLSPELFRDILEDIMEASEQARVSAAVSQGPVSPNNDGIYYLDLIKLLQAFPEISSKKALKQFMEETSFARLELICNHLPPWMETVIALKNFDQQIEKIDQHSCKVVITVKQGEQDA